MSGSSGIDSLAESRQRSPGYMVGGVLAVLGVLITMFVLSALQAVHEIDRRSYESELVRAARALDDLAAHHPDPASAAEIDHLAFVSALDRARLVSEGGTRDGEAAIPLPPALSAGRPMLLAWTPHRLGSEVFMTVAPVRLGSVAVMVPIIALILWRFRNHALELDRRRRAARDLASRDSLTGLANRLAFESDLDAALARTGADPAPLAVLYLDLDGFKRVNDTLGHAAGDALLQGVGRRLRAAARPGDLVARLGGDEFVVIVPGISTPEAARERGDAFLKSLTAPHEVGGRYLSSQASIGIALAPMHGTTRDDLMLNADAALYCAKASAAVRIVVYEPSMEPGYFAYGPNSRVA